MPESAAVHRSDRDTSTYLKKTTFSKVMDFLPRLDEIQVYEQVFSHAGTVQPCLGPRATEAQEPLLRADFSLDARRR